VRLHAAQKSLRWWPIHLTGVLLLKSLLAPAVGATHASAKRATQPSVAIKGAPFKGAVAKGVVNLSALPKATANANPASQPSLPLPQRGLSPQQQAEYDKNAIHLPGMPSAVGHPTPSPHVATSPSFVGGGVLPPVYKSFEGLNSTQGTGNNTSGQSMATDLSYVMQVTPNAIGIFSSASGALLYGPYTSSSFFAPVKLSGDFLVEPQTFYDVMRDRWIVVYSELTTSSVIDHGYIDIAVSQTSSPTQPTPGGQYWLYRLEATQFNTQYGERCSTPQIGADYWGLYIACQAMGNGPSGFIDNYILALDKTRLYNGMSASGSVYKSIPAGPNTCGAGGNSPCPARALNPAVEDGVPALLSVQT